jgi:enoyl reductase-like protein
MQTPDEERELTEVIDRLMKKFPDAAADEVEAAVTLEYVALTGNPVRDFVPVLVEKQAKKRLKAAHPKKH